MLRLVLLLDVLLLLLERNLDIIDPGVDVDVVARSKNDTAVSGYRCRAGSTVPASPVGAPNVGEASNARLVAALWALRLSWIAFCSSEALASASEVASTPSSTANSAPVCST